MGFGVGGAELALEEIGTRYSQRMFQALAHSSILLFIHLLVIVTFSVRVIMRRPATGVALAWLFIMAAIPFGGAVAYLLVGEKRIGRERIQRIAKLRESSSEVVDALMHRDLVTVDWTRHPQEAREMNRLVSNWSACRR